MNNILWCSNYDGINHFSITRRNIWVHFLLSGTSHYWCLKAHPESWLPVCKREVQIVKQCLQLKGLRLTDVSFTHSNICATSNLQCEQRHPKSPVLTVLVLPWMLARMTVRFSGTLSDLWPHVYSRVKGSVNDWLRILWILCENSLYTEFSQAIKPY